MFDEKYFYRLGVTKRVLEYADYDQALKICDELIKRGLNSHLDLETRSLAFKRGKEKADFLLNLARGDDRIIQKILYKEPTIH